MTDILEWTSIGQAAEDLSDEALLRYYVKEWDRYTNGATYVHRLFTYLNRHWVKREKDEGRKNVYLIYIVSLLLLEFRFEKEKLIAERRDVNS